MPISSASLPPGAPRPPSRRSPWTALAALGFAAALLLAATAATAASLRPYASESEFEYAVQRWRDGVQQRQGLQRRAAQGAALSMAPAAAPAAAKSAADSSAVAAESITNVQTAGVDEGGIVKRAGDHLLVLRRGRLFTVRVGGGRLEPVAAVDAYAPGSDPRGAWYDELLVSGSTVVVVGYSYARGGTEVGLFELGSDGALAWRATYHLRSGDYYASRNYASRLVGSRLLFYTPLPLNAWGGPTAEQLPAWRRWQSGLPADFQRLLPATRIYRSGDDFSPDQALALHTVTACDLAATPMRCEASAVLGPAGRVFYVAASAVYVWTNPVRQPPRAAPLSAVFRLPLDGAAPGGVKTAGVPVDQLSFLEDEGGQLNVLLRAGGSGEGMWGAESSEGALALLRLPLSDFGDGRSAARADQYRRLPGPSTGALQNRYVGDWLLWGGGDRAWAFRHASASAAERAAERAPTPLAPGHAIERIEALGDQALLVGNAGSELRFSAVRLDGRGAQLAGRQAMPGVRQGESRTHGFFYRSTGPDEGLLGLPVIGPGGGAWPGTGRPQGAAAVVFMRQRGGQFTALGELAAGAAPMGEDGCKASCVDWYGNARPIFLGSRVLALMGYEIVEGRIEPGSGGRGADERVVEQRRIDFSPGLRNLYGHWHRPGRPSPFD